MNDRRAGTPAAIRARLWQLYLLAGAVFGALYVITPSWTKGPIFNAFGLSSVLAILVGVRLHRPSHRLPWFLFAAGMLVFVIGDVFYYSIPQILHTAAPNSPSTGDIFYLSVYPLLMAGMVLLIRHRNRSRDWPSLIDALIISAGVAMVAWVFLIEPYAGARMSLMAKIVSAAYPLMDIAVLAVTARLTVGGGIRKPVLSLLVASVVFLLGTDTIYGLIILHGTYTTGGLLDAGWIAFYLLWGAAALHPSMRTLSEPSPERPARLTPVRLGLLGAATLIAPVIQLYHESLGDPPLFAVSAGSALVSLLVVARMAGLLHRFRESLGREQVLREAGAALVSATNRQESLEAAVMAVEAVMGPERQVHLFVVGDSGVITRVGGALPGHAAAREWPSVTLSPDGWEFLARWRRPSAELGGLAGSLGFTEGNLWACPLVQRDDLRAFVVVSGGPPVTIDAEHSVLALVSQVALALESHELSEQYHRKSSEARFLSLVQNATDVVTVVSRDTTILYQSPSGERVLGYAPTVLLGTSLSSLLHPEDRMRALELLEAVDPDRPPVKTEIRVRHADGSWRHLETLLANLLGDSNVGGFVLNSRDVTEERRAREARELLQQRLDQSQRLEAIGQLAGGVAHDFNNMLAVILTYVNLVTKELQKNPEGNEQSTTRVGRDVEKIREAATRASTLVQQLLILGRRDAVNPEVLDLNATVSDLEKLLSRTLGEHIVLRTRLTGERATVCADRSGLDQVLMNLVVNARDAMPAGGTLLIETTTVQIDHEVAWAPGLAPGPYVCLGVSDTGMGMTHEVVTRAFEPFYTTKPRGQGSGLGLATVYGIARQAGGDVHIYSEPKVGTTVRVYLPAEREDLPLPAPAPATQNRTGSGQRILLVEDDTEVREGTRRLLIESGYEVITARNGADAEAISKGWAGPIDLLLTDMVMPGMPGSDLARSLRRSRPEVKVLFVSGYPQDVISSSTHLNHAGILPKPFTEASLLQAVGAALDRGSAP